MATPSLAMIPSGYKASKVYSVLPESGVGDFDFTRATTATRINSSGLIEEMAINVPRLEYPLIDGVVNGCPSLILEPQRTNFITYSSDFPRNYWTKSGATIQGDSSTLGSELVTNGSFTGSASGWALGSGWAYSSNAINATSTSSVCYQDIAAMQSNITYTVTYQISNYSGGNIQWRFGGTGTVDGATRNANGTYTESFTNSSSGDKRLFLSPSGFTGTIDNVSVKETQGFTSPDGTTNAYKLVEDTSNGQHQIFPTSSSGTDAVRTISFFVKMDGVSKIGIRNNDGKYITYDIVNNTTLDKTITNDIVSSDFNNGWKKLSITWDSTTVITGARIFLLNDAYTSGNPLTYSYTGDGTSGVYLFGAQVEEGSFQTSYIPTNGSTTTRNAETCTGAGNAATFSDSEGVLMVEAATLVELLTQNHIISIHDGTTNNRVRIYWREDVPSELIFSVFDGGVLIYTYTTTSIALDDMNKVCLRYGSNNFSAWANGFKLDEQTSGGSLSLQLNTLDFNKAIGSASNAFYGNTKQIQYYNSVLTESELEKLTSWTSFSDMANGQQYSII